MKNTLYIMLAFGAVALVSSCKEESIQPYKIEDSAVVFHAKSNQYSLKGVTDPKIELEIPVDLVGRLTDYDREINVFVLDTVKSNTAVEGKDFIIKRHVLDSMKMDTKIILEINNLPEDVEKLSTTLAIEPNKYFRAGYPEFSKSTITWSKEYVRPQREVWRYWYTFISHGYSKSYHELLMNIIGPEIEITTNSQSYVKDYPELIFQPPTWWYSINRLFREKVQIHDEENPDSPYMHSDDYKTYTGWEQSADAGEPAEKTPTILETLVII